MTLRLLLLVELMLAGPPALATAQLPPSWGGMQPGKYPVGFHAWAAIDSSGVLAGPPHRVVVAVWFPLSKSPAGAPLHYRDYLGVNALEREASADSAARDAAARSFAGFLTSNGIAGERVDAWLASAMLARWHDLPKDQTRPMVLLAQGNGQAAYSQAVLAEYLASRGFVVITTPSPLRTGATLTSEHDVYPVAALQADELAFALAAVAGQGTGDARRVAVVGHSFGGRAGLLLLARRATAELISLDGGLGMAAAKDWLEGAPVTVDAIEGRVVHLYETTDSLLRPDFTLLRSMVRARREVIEAPGLAHWQFTSFGTIAEHFPDVAPGFAAPGSGRVVEAVLRYSGCRLEEWAANKSGTSRCSTAGLQPQKHLPPLRQN